MQRSSDRQKMLAAHGVPISDERLIEILDMRRLTAVEGRIPVHGQDEQSRPKLLEGTDAKVHFVYYTPEMDEARSRGGLRTNYFVRLRKLFLAGRPSLDIRDLGDAEKLLNNRRLLEENARALLKRGVIPTEDGWGGWLGKYQAAMASTANEIGRNRELRSTPSLERRRDRYHPERIAWALRSGARYLDRMGVSDRLIARQFRLLAGHTTSPAPECRPGE